VIVRALLIVNPNATTTTPAARDLIAHALASTLRVQVAHTAYRGHAAELAAQATADGVPIVIVLGGDGTVNEVVNGILGAPRPGTLSALTMGPLPAVGVVPGGSANVFARSLGIKQDPLDAASQLLSLIELRHRRRIGLGHVQDRWFLFNSGMGLDALVVEAVEAHRANGRVATSGRYVRAAFRTFAAIRNQPPSLTVHLPMGDTIDGVYYAFVSNASPWTYLDQRPVLTNPLTTYDTGLGLFAMRSMEWLPTLRVARQLAMSRKPIRSRHLCIRDDIPELSIRSDRPIAVQVDGDFIGPRTDVDFYYSPEAIEVIAPKFV
jgi:diacylglycerol kinase family enzyme